MNNPQEFLRVLKHPTKFCRNPKESWGIRRNPYKNSSMTAEISTMRLDIGDIQEALKNHDSWMEDVSNTLQQMQEKEENLTEDIFLTTSP